jgi:regulator of sigma E protease
LDQPHTPDHADPVKPPLPPGADHRALTQPGSPGAHPSRNGDADAGPAPAPPLTPAGWLMSNGPYLVMMLVCAVWLYRSFGADGLVRAAMVILGLGFVIFIHELGHFLTAKWCDVHVQTFSIGFGPALPGCSFVRGETTYKVAVLPLGGYVNMVGEGPDTDEDEDYPRSFKNKSVGQRMLIISAGVIMNVIFGALCFIVVYRYHGVERPLAVVWRTEAGSRAWQEGVRPGWKVTEVGDKKDPFFDDMRIAIALSRSGQGIPFVFTDREGHTHERTIEPLRDDNNLVPVIGVAPVVRLKLLSERSRKVRETPAVYGSAAARARALELGRGDVVVEATDPGQNGKVTPLPSGAKGWQELARRMRQAGDEPMTLMVRHGGKVEAALEKIEVKAAGFDFGDVIIGTTDPATPDEPFNVTALPPDPNQEPKKQAGDPFAFHKRMDLLTGKPVVIQVRREGTSAPVDVFVPPGYHRTLGLRMKMGKVAALREDSPAERAGLKPGEEIKGVQFTYDNKLVETLDEKALDPLRLPDELARRIQNDPKRPDVKKWKVILTVIGTVNHDALKDRPLEPMSWDDSWQSGTETPTMPAAPMSIPQLGIAYWVDSTVLKVEPGSPAALAKLEAGDEIRSFRVRELGRKPTDETWSQWAKMYSTRGKGLKVYDQWAYYFWELQRADYPIIEVTIARKGQELSESFGPMEAVLDTTWPMQSRGFIFLSDTVRQQAHSFREAFLFGVDQTTSFIKRIYLNLSSLLSGRISTKTLGGPVEIASQAFSFAGENFFDFALFLGIISINLAVVNFLPIPVLDGGHMVFLIYEKLRGRPASEMVRTVATYVGLCMILSLMLFVFYQDFQRRGWLPSWMSWS